MQQDGYRYLDLPPQQVLALTHREFFMMLEQRVEKTYDELEREAVKAIMMRAAYHSDKKNMKPTDIFDRNHVGEDDEDIKEKMERQQNFVNNLQFGKEGNHE